MAGRIAGITIEIGGDTSNLQKSLKGVDSQLRQTQNQLRDVNKLLKLNPGNTELLRQKQKALTDAIAQTKNRLQQLKDAQSQVQKGSAEWDALQREIIATEQDLETLEGELRSFGSVASQQLKVAGQKMQAFGDKVSGVGEKLKPISTAAAGALAGLVGLGYNAVTTADDLNTLAKQTGISTEEIQKMKYAADLVDVSFEDIAGAVRKLKSKMDPTNETLQQLGVSVLNADGSMRDATDVFYDSIAALSQIENETERDQVAMALFGKSADQLAGIIDDGGAALKEYGDQAEELGLIMGQDTLDNMNALNDVIDQLKANLGGTLAQIGADVASILAPALEKAASVISKVTAKIRNMTPQQKALVMKILAVVAAVAPALIITGKVIKVIGTLTTVLGTVIGVLGGPLTLAIAAVIAAGVLLYKNWDKIKVFAKKLYTDLQKTFNNIKTAITNAWNNVKTATINAWNNVKTATTNAWNNVKNAISNSITNAKNSVSSVLENIKSSMSGAWESIKSSASTAFESIKSAITSPIQSAKDTIDGIIDKIKGLFPLDIGNIFSNLKLPHFSIDWGTVEALGATISWPKGVKVQWYKKAMENAIMLNGATIFGSKGGKLLGGGEAGREMVVSYDKLAKMMGTTINVTVNAAAGMNEAQLADMVARRIQQSVNNRRAVWA